MVEEIEGWTYYEWQPTDRIGNLKGWAAAHYKHHIYKAGSILNRSWWCETCQEMILNMGATPPYREPW